MAALEVGYLMALRSIGPSRVIPGEPVATRRQVTWFSLGILTLLVAAEWPIHDLAERYLFSVHMLQHMMISLVAPPLILLGLPQWLLRLVLSPRPVMAVARQLTRPLVALLIFNGVIVVTHWPPFVNQAVHSELFHFCAHLLLFWSAILMWWPVVSPLPEMPSLSYPARMFYLFLQSIVPTVPASFLTFGSTPLYPFYESAPRIWGIDALTDMRIAGLTMKIVGGFILWGVIAVMFFKWHIEEQRTEGWDSLEWQRWRHEDAAGVRR